MTDDDLRKALLLTFALVHSGDNDQLGEYARAVFRLNLCSGATESDDDIEIEILARYLASEEKLLDKEIVEILTTFSRGNHERPGTH